MFDFEKLVVYQKINALNVRVLKYLSRSTDIDDYLRDQWKRATLSVALNLVEGSGRVTPADKKRFYTISRSSVNECVAILNTLKGTDPLKEELLKQDYSDYEEISKILLAL